MEISLLCIGNTHIPFVKQGIEHYLKRLVHYIPFGITELPDVKTSAKKDENKQKIAEGEMILKKLNPSDYVILLDSRGKQYDSLEFASYIEKLTASGRKRVVFIIGGPYGFSDAVYQRSDAMLSLSKMTFNHEMVRLFFTEQVYRAMTILRGEPYHHE